MKTFTVTLVFESIKAEDALAASKIVANNFLDDPDELHYRVMNEETKQVEDIEGLYDGEDDWEDEYEEDDEEGWEDEYEEDDEEGWEDEEDGQNFDDIVFREFNTPDQD